MVRLILFLNFSITVTKEFPEPICNWNDYSRRRRPHALVYAHTHAQERASWTIQAMLKHHYSKPLAQTATRSPRGKPAASTQNQRQSRRGQSLIQTPSTWPVIHGATRTLNYIVNRQFITTLCTTSKRPNSSFKSSAPTPRCRPLLVLHLSQ